MTHCPAIRPVSLAVVFCAALTALTALTDGASAQTNDDVNAGVQFNFSTPGARSLGLGGAFLGLADDATAAYSNPAGLVSLVVGGSEVSVEVRRWRYSHRFPDRGHADGEPTGIGVDTISGVLDGEASNEVTGLSFLSLGLIMPRGWNIALYRHELAQFEAGIERQGLLVGSGDRVRRINPSRSLLDLRVTGYGLSSAVELREGFSVGLGVTYYEGELDSQTDRFNVFDRDADGDGDVDRADDLVNRQTGGFFGPPDFLGDNLLNRQIQRGEGHDWGVNVGVLKRWHSGLSVGAAYRQGPDFPVEASYLFGQRAEERNPNEREGERHPGLGGPATLHVPSVWGVGVAWSGRNGNLKLAFDYDRIEYSRLTDDFTNLLLRDADFDPANYLIEDGNEFHAGLEYVFLPPTVDTTLVGTVRLGAYWDPPHTLEYIGPDALLRARFPARDGEYHFAAGLGFVIRENFQIDVAADFSKRAHTLSVSLVHFL